MILIKSFLTVVLYDCFKHTYIGLNEGDTINECYSRLKLMAQADLHIAFFTIFLVKQMLLKLFYWHMILLLSTTVIKHRIKYEVF